MKDLSYIAPGPDMNGWKDTHRTAVRRALGGTTGIPSALVYGLQDWINYAKAHEKRYESPIGQDYVLGPAWAEWGRALRTMLNGETGDLDCGTLDSIILDNLVEQGFGEE